jgi:inhibitor of KinA sporulation pathway (predicted exonuclease)
MDFIPGKATLSKLKVGGTKVKESYSDIDTEDNEYFRAISAWTPHVGGGAQASGPGELCGNLLHRAVIERHIKSPYMLKGSVKHNDGNLLHNYKSNLTFHVVHKDGGDPIKVDWEEIMRKLKRKEPIAEVFHKALIINTITWLPPLDQANMVHTKISNSNDIAIQPTEENTQSTNPICDNDTIICREINPSSIPLPIMVVNTTSNNSPITSDPFSDKHCSELEDGGTYIHQQPNGMYSCKFEDVDVYSNSDRNVCVMCLDAVESYVHPKQESELNSAAESCLDIHRWNLDPLTMFKLKRMKEMYTRLHGVSRESAGTWRASITVNLGSYSTAEEAAKAYDLACLVTGSASPLNFPDANYSASVLNSIVLKIFNQSK